MIGSTISHYKIIEKIGEGGMGEVYLAEDLKLERQVAIKFLPRHLTKDKDNVERFEREAKAAASLNHPNIVTIYDIIEEDDQIFIIMEYVEGKALRDLISPNSQFLIPNSVGIISQISDGLSKAHDAGIVHRDIKPENIMIDKDGRVKILDFGLAKLKGVSKLTRESSTLGTLHYMSPEQIQGKEVDQRADIWSVGIVLYELLAGEVPFKGEYESSLHYAILNEEPDKLSDKRKDMPVGINHIISHVLAKDPDNRYQKVIELMNDLNSLQKPIHPEKRTKRPSLLKSRVFIGLSALFTLFLLVTMVLLITPTAEHRGLQITYTSPLTTVPGLEEDPSWSPEGTRIAYTSDESGNMDIWVRQIAAGQKINLTGDHGGYDGKPAWSPDGEWIAFVSERNGGGIFILPALGGIPKQIISLSFGISISRAGAVPDIAWSPDGSKLVYSLGGQLFTISSAGGDPQALPLPPTGLVVGYLQPAWSPDGERIICTGILGPGIATSQIWSLHPEEGDPVPVTEGKFFEQHPTWSADGKYLFFVSDRAGNPDIWVMPVNEQGMPVGEPRPLTAGSGVGMIALSSDGKRLAYTKTTDRSNIWSIPITTDRMIPLSEARPLTAENHYIETLHISPDGQWIAFDANRRGNMDIWIMRKDGSQLRQLTTHQAHDWYPQWSPDAEKILFHSIRHGNRDLFVIPARGGALQQLTDHPAQDLAAVWSPDGTKIAFLSNRAGNMDAWLMQSDGTILAQLTLEDAQEFILLWSPDGKQIAYCSNRSGYYELYIISSDQYFIDDKERRPKQVTDGKWTSFSPLYWSEDKKTIFAFGEGGPGHQGANLWAVSITDGAVRPLIDFQGSLKEPSSAWDSDGERIYFPLIERSADLWMAEISGNE